MKGRTGVAYYIYCFLALGLAVVNVLYSYRIREERKLFRVAVNKDFYEGRHLSSTCSYWA